MKDFLNLLLTPDFLFSVLRISTPLIFGTLAHYVASKAGLLNIAVEGMMLTAALLGVVFSYLFGAALPGFLLAVVIGAVIGFFLGYLSETLKADIFLTGIAFNLIASGFTVFLLFLISGDKGVSTNLRSFQMPTINIPVLENLYYVGRVISGHNVLTYFSFVCAVIMYVFMNKTRIGLRIRAVGENELAAKSVGIKARRLKLLAISISGALAAMGGCYLSMGYLSNFNAGMTSGRGFISLSANAMSGGSVLGGMLVSLLFGFADTITNFAQQYFDIPVELILTTPYVFVIAALVIYNVDKNRRARRIKE